MLQLMFEFGIEAIEFLLSGDWKKIKRSREKKRKQRAQMKVEERRMRSAGKDESANRD